MNGETIITAENSMQMLRIICSEYSADAELRIVYYIADNLDWKSPPTLAELREEVRERFGEYIAGDGK